LLNDEALSYVLSEPKLFAVYDVAMSLESLEVVTSQLDALRAEGEQRPISDGERQLRKVLEDLAAMLNEAVRDGLRRLHATD
jgi:hypothetical protein